MPKQDTALKGGKRCDVNRLEFTKYTVADVEKRKYVTADDCAEVRRGLHNPYHGVSNRSAVCAQCRQLIREPDRLGVVIAGVEGIHFLHLREMTCLNAIARKRAAQKPIVVKVPPIYEKTKAGWVLTPDEIKIAQFIKDNRLPRRVTQCRICGKDIVAGQGRATVKVKDDHGWNVREGFVHQTCRPQEKVA